MPRNKPAVRTQRLDLTLPWGLLEPLLPQGDGSRWGGVFSTTWLSLIRVLRAVGRVCASESVWSSVELLNWMLRLQNSGWQAWPCPVFTLQPIYPGKDWHVFIDGLGKVFRLFLQPEAHNQVFMLFLGDVYCQDSL